MLLNSSYHDYYDSISNSLGIDKSLVFNRNTTTVAFQEIYQKLSQSMIDRLMYARQIVNSRSTSEYYQLQPIIFCGKLYWIRSKKNDDFDEKKGNLSVTWEQADDEYVISRQYSWDREKMKLSDISSYDYTDLCILLNSSIIAIEGRIVEFDIPGRSTMKFVLYPQLKQFNFQKVVDPYTAFQEIQMFNFGVLSSVEKPEILSNESRIVAGGFDLKTSFRNIK